MRFANRRYNKGKTPAEMHDLVPAQSTEAQKHDVGQTQQVTLEEAVERLETQRQYQGKEGEIKEFETEKTEAPPEISKKQAKKILKEEKKNLKELQDLEDVLEAKQAVVGSIHGKREESAVLLEYIVYVHSTKKVDNYKYPIVEIFTIKAYSKKQAKAIANKNWGWRVLEVLPSTPEAIDDAERVKTEMKKRKTLRKEWKDISDEESLSGVPQSALKSNTELVAGMAKSVPVKEYKRKPPKLKKKVKKALKPKNIRKVVGEYWSTH